MSELEQMIKPLIIALFDLQDVTLLPSGQRLLALWAVKTVMVVEHTFAGLGVYYRPNERAAMRERAEMPVDTTVLIATSDVPRFAFVNATPRWTAGIAEPNVPVAPGRLTIFALGPLVLRIESHRWREVTGRPVLMWPPRIARLADWIEPIGGPLVWPLPHRLNDVQFAELVSGQSGW